MANLMRVFVVMLLIVLLIALLVVLLIVLPDTAHYNRRYAS